MKYNLQQIMLKAWKIFRKNKDLNFAECLHRSWLSAKAVEENNHRVERAKETAGIKENVDTWAGWKKAGYEVIHGSKSLFCVSLLWGSHGDGATYKASFFSRSQVQAIA